MVSEQSLNVVRSLVVTWESLAVVLSELKLLEESGEEPERDLWIAMIDKSCYQEVHTLHVPTATVVELEGC